MKKKIVILVGEIDSSGRVGSSGLRFIENMKKYSDDEYIMKRYTDICITIKDGHVDVLFLDDETSIDDADLVYLRGIGNAPIRHTLASYLNATGIPIVNSEADRFQVMTKLEQGVVLALNGVPVPDSVFVGKVAYYKRALELFELSFPVIAKSISGRNGRDNTLLKSWSDLEQLDFIEPIFQPFIPNQFDYRVITAGNHVSLAYKRIRNVEVEGYKNNISQGGTREILDLSQELKDIALQASSAVGREFSGVDILTDSESGKSVVLEVNFNFGTPVFDETDAERLYYEDIIDYFSSLAK